MPTRRSIAWLLAAVYLLMAAGAPFATLSCECLASHDHAELCAPCHNCAGDCALRLAASCCSDAHSTEISLYLAIADSMRSFVRCAVTDLPPALYAGWHASAPRPDDGPLFVRRSQPLAPDPATRTPGFRAPPVRL